MSTTLMNITENKTADQDQVKLVTDQLNDQDFCILGKKCSNRFCMADLLKFRLKRNRENDSIKFYQQIICSECYKQLCRCYDLFYSRRLGKHFFNQWLGVKTAAALNKMKLEIENEGCNCGRKDCKFTKLSLDEHDRVNRSFVGLMGIFAFRVIATDTNKFY